MVVKSEQQLPKAEQTVKGYLDVTSQDIIQSSEEVRIEYTRSPTGEHSIIFVIGDSIILLWPFADVIKSVMDVAVGFVNAIENPDERR